MPWFRGNHLAGAMVQSWNSLTQGTTLETALELSLGKADLSRPFVGTALEPSSGRVSNQYLIGRLFQKNEKYIQK